MNSEAVVAAVPYDCGGGPIDLPSLNEVDKLLPSLQTASLLGGSANFVFTVPNYAQTLYFGHDAYTYTLTTDGSVTTVSGLACQPTIVGWALTYRSSFVTSTQTVSGSHTFYTPFLTATDSPITGCFATATIAQNAGDCVSRATSTSTYTALNCAAVATSLVTFVKELGAIQIGATKDNLKSSVLYPLSLTFPYQATSITLTPPSLDTTLTISIVSTEVTPQPPSAASLTLILSATTSTPSTFMVSQILLTQPVYLVAEYIPTSSRFAFKSVSASCGPAVTYNAVAKVCKIGNPGTSMQKGECAEGAGDTDVAFSVTLVPSSRVYCGFSATVRIVQGCERNVSDDLPVLTSVVPTKPGGGLASGGSRLSGWPGIVGAFILGCFLV
ncbi:hypothetical protein HDU79_003222 [Rhizoclosmatium sp. JEL0117]|nr:hypothetical protein HDU79_003222 [Rhizoclosmatium sp. JEL0117]